MLFVALTAVPSHAALSPAGVQAAVPAASTLRIEGLGKGTTPLSGPWQFHLGDDPAWAQPDTADATGMNGWEQLSADKTWGVQGHPAYVGFAWYRLHLHIDPATGASPDFALLLRGVEDVYEIYWNGQRVAGYGKMPPHATGYWFKPAQTFGLGAARDGVLAIRVWKAPLESFDTDKLGGFEAVPEIGSPEAIAAAKAELDYGWLRRRQFDFGIVALHGLVFLLSFLGWLRNRSQWVLAAMAAYTGGRLFGAVLVAIGIPFSYNFALGAVQPLIALTGIGEFYLLVYLLRLDENPRILRMTRVVAIIVFSSELMDGALTFLDWSNPVIGPWLQRADGLLTATYSLTQPYPMVLIVLALVLRKRLDSARWLVASTAFLSNTTLMARVTLDQGSRFTHWTLAAKISRPLFYVNGNPFTMQEIADSLMLLAVVYAVSRFVREAFRRQSAREQEYKSARELQQVLIPETLPEVPGYAVTSAYRPAQEVGGDFFQIIPLEGEYAGSTLVLLGDVSGKGLKAAMTVSLIVGAVRTLAKFAPEPAKLLTELNQRMWGRMQDGFTTCLAMILRPDGHCTLASAGHPAPFLNERELDLPGALPLGLTADARYAELAFDLREGDQFSLYTDGLLEARNVTGELFSFARVDALFATRPDAARATEAAVDFGQDDDITVLTLTRLATGERSTTELSTPVFALG